MFGVFRPTRESYKFFFRNILMFCCCIFPNKYFPYLTRTNTNLRHLYSESMPSSQANPLIRLNPSLPWQRFIRVKKLFSRHLLLKKIMLFAKYIRYYMYGVNRARLCCWPFKVLLRYCGHVVFTLFRKWNFIGCPEIFVQSCNYWLNPPRGRWQ